MEANFLEFNIGRPSTRPGVAAGLLVHNTNGRTMPETGESKAMWAERLWKHGCLLGAVFPLIVGLFLIATTIEFSAAERNEPSCGTRAAGGILVICYGCPLLALLCSGIGFLVGIAIDGSDQNTEP